MIVVYKSHRNGGDPVLAYDAEEEELWGYPDYWEGSLDLVGLPEEEFAKFFDTHRLMAFRTDEDPFEEMPNAEDLLANYPVGSEEIPDLPTPEPLDKPSPLPEDDADST